MTQIIGSPFAVGNGPQVIALSMNKNIAYVANNGDNTVSGYNITNAGALVQVPNSPYTTGAVPTGIAVTPSGKFAYVSNYNSNSISAYKIGYIDKTTQTSNSLITAFSLNGIPGVINDQNIIVTMPFGKNIASLIAKFSIGGISAKVGNTVQISGVTSNNFSSPVEYEVTAANGSTSIYTVSVIVSPKIIYQFG